MLRYLDEESALYAAGVAVDDTERELAAAEAARRKAGAPPSKRPKGLESKAWKGGFFDTKRPAAKAPTRCGCCRRAVDAPGAAAAAAPPPWEELTGPQSAEGAAELEPRWRSCACRRRRRPRASARPRRHRRRRRAARRARALRARPAGRPRGAGRRARARAGHSVVGLHREEKRGSRPELLRRARGDGGSARRRAAEAQRVRRRREGRGGDGRDEPEARGPAALRAAGPGEPAEPKRGVKFEMLRVLIVSRPHGGQIRFCLCARARPVFVLLAGARCSAIARGRPLQRTLTTRSAAGLKRASPTRATSLNSRQANLQQPCTATRREHVATVSDIGSRQRRRRLGRVRWCG